MIVEITEIMKRFISKISRRCVALVSIAVFGVFFLEQGFAAESEQSNQKPDRVEV
jgi:hypothetical protein